MCGSSSSADGRRVWGSRGSTAAASARAAAAATGLPPAHRLARFSQLLPLPLPTPQIQLDPFGTISNCLPISVLVQPNATSDQLFTLVVEAEPSVLAALSHNVTGAGQGGTLLLENTADFNTTRPIKMTVTMPVGALRAINHQGTGTHLLHLRLLPPAADLLNSAARLPSAC